MDGFENENIFTCILYILFDSNDSIYFPFTPILSLSLSLLYGMSRNRNGIRKISSRCGNSVLVKAQNAKLASEIFSI